VFWQSEKKTNVKTPTMCRLEVQPWAKLRGCWWGGKGKERSITASRGCFSVYQNNLLVSVKLES